MKMQKQSFANVLPNKCSKKFRIFHWKTPLLETLFNKVEGPQPCNFIQNRLQHRRFPVKFAVIFGAPMLKNISERLLLSVIITEKKFLENLETLRNRSTSCEDCFLGTVESDRKKKIFSYH